MNKELSYKCKNCANACITQSANRVTLNTRYCIQWNEIVMQNHSCTEYYPIHEGGYVTLQDPKTKRINIHNYPLELLNQ